MTEETVNSVQSTQSHTSTANTLPNSKSSSKLNCSLTSYLSDFFADDSFTRLIFVPVSNVIVFELQNVYCRELLRSV